MYRLFEIDHTKGERTESKITRGFLWNLMSREKRFGKFGASPLLFVMLSSLSLCCFCFVVCR